MDVEPFVPIAVDDLIPGATVERGHLDGALVGDMEIPDLRLFECMVSDCQGGDVVLTNLRSTGTTVLGTSLASLRMPGAVVYSGRFEGVRVGAMIADGGDLSVLRIVASRIDVLSLREAKVRRLEIRDSRVGLLDLTGARISEAIVVGGSVDELSPSRTRPDGFDVSGTELGRVLDPAALAGVTISAQQAMDLGADLARSLGATVVD